MSNGVVIWITGLSAAGKSTVAQAVCKRLRELGTTPVYLDGDVLRQLVPFAAGYTEVKRRTLAQFYSRLAEQLSQQGHVIVFATMSLFHEIQARNRRNIPHYLEVLLRVSLPTLLRRDRKRFYAIRGEKIVIASGVRMELPLTPHLIIDNENEVTSARAADAIIAKLKLMGFLPSQSCADVNDLFGRA